MNPISACLIVRHDQHLAKTLACLRPHVAEFVIVFTGTRAEYDAAWLTLGEAVGPVDERPFTRVSFYPDASDADGEILDFAKARQFSFDQATQPWILWVDSDDLIEGLENLPLVLDEAEAQRALEGRHVRVIAPYEYQYDEKGQCISRQERERILSNDGPGTWRWQRPVHEGCVAVDRAKQVDISTDKIVWRHQSPPGRRTFERNLRILRAYAAQQAAEIEANPLQEEDPRTFFDLGVECELAGLVDEAIGHFLHFIEIAQRGEDRAEASLHLSALTWRAAWERWGPGVNPIDARTWALQACIQGKRFQDFYAVAKIEWVASTLRQDPERVSEALIYGRKALEAPTSHIYSTNPHDRLVGIHELMVDCCMQREYWGEARKHLRALEALRPGDPALMLKHRECRLKEHVSLYTTGFDLDIVIACAHTADKWNPAIYKQQGLGGSETAVIEMARRLANEEHRVRVYCDCGEAGLYDDVEYRQSDEIFHAGSCDILVSWRSAAFVDPALLEIDAKVKVIWAHDPRVDKMTHRRSLHADKILALSSWHADQLCGAHKLHPDNVAVTRNGIDLQRFHAFSQINDCPKCGGTGATRDGSCEACDGDGCGSSTAFPVRNPHKVIYSSSADRGLAALLGMWPAIRAKVPDAELHVFYGFDTFEKGSGHPLHGHPMIRGYIHSLKHWMKLLEPHGVFARGRVDQTTLAQEMLSAGVWAYPTHNPSPETSCIGAMEAQAAGLHIVTSKAGALPETVGENGVLVEGDWLDEKYQEDFVIEVVEAMTGGSTPFPIDREGIRASAGKRFPWDGVATEWEAMFRSLLADAADFLLPAYRGAA